MTTWNLEPTDNVVIPPSICSTRPLLQLQFVGLLPSVTQKHALLGSEQLTELAISLLGETLGFHLKYALGHYPFGCIYYLVSFGASDWIWAECSPVRIRIHPATSCHNIASIMFDSYYGMFWAYFSLPIILVRLHLCFICPKNFSRTQAPLDVFWVPVHQWFGPCCKPVFTFMTASLDCRPWWSCVPLNLAGMLCFSWPRKEFYNHPL